MKKRTPIQSFAILTTVLMTTSLFSLAHPPIDDPVGCGIKADDGCLRVGQRPLDPEEQLRFFKMREAELQKELEARKQNQETTNIPSRAYYSPYAAHWVNTVGVYGDSIELEDGSWWQIAPADKSIAASWSLNAYNPNAYNPNPSMGKAEVVITPNTSWVSSYTYQITNKNGTSVKANLSVGPVPFTQGTHWITGIDYPSGYLYLENGTRWSILNTDKFVFNNWAVNDTIIMGVNDSWLFTVYDFILINVNMNNYIKANQY